jgi:hypothetical protein
MGSGFHCLRSFSFSNPISIKKKSVDKDQQRKNMEMENKGLYFACHNKH